MNAINMKNVPLLKAALAIGNGLFISPVVGVFTVPQATGDLVEFYNL